MVRGGGEQRTKGLIQAQDQGAPNENSAWLRVTMDAGGGGVGEGRRG